MRRAILATASVAGLVLAGGAPARAAGPAVVTEMHHLDHEVSVISDVHPCTGAPASITLTETGVLKFMLMTDDTVHISGNTKGTFSLDLVPADGVPDATGTFVSTFGGSGLLRDEGDAAVGRAVSKSTLTVFGVNADGSEFRAHLNGTTVFGTDGSVKHEAFNSQGCD